VDRSPGDLAEGVRAAAARLAPHLEVVVPEPLPPVAFDADALDTMLANLVDNALKYGGGTVEVSVAREGSKVALTVADRGPGVPSRMRRRLFRPFTRAAGPDGPAGLGLGLALVDGLARAHGGRARFRARPGGGSAFTVLFPVA
jgi:signal transduction histidine kinase